MPLKFQMPFKAYTHIKCYVYKALHSHTSPLTGSTGYEHTLPVLAVQVLLPTQTSCWRCGTVALCVLVQLPTTH